MIGALRNRRECSCCCGCCCSVTQSLWPHGLQHARLPCPSLSPWVCSNSCPLSHWFHPNISSSVTTFSSCLQSFPASGSFPGSWLFTSGGEHNGASASASASVPPVNIQDWFPLGLTRPSFTHSHSLPPGSFHKPLILIHQRADRMKTTIIEN